MFLITRVVECCRSKKGCINPIKFFVWDIQDHLIAKGQVPALMLHNKGM